MSHKVDPSISHAKLHHHLTNGKPLNIQGYSHAVCIRKEKFPDWEAKGYEVIQEADDAFLVGKKKAKKEEGKPKDTAAAVAAA